MAWWTYVEAILGGGAVLWGIVFGLSGHLGDRLLEQMKAQHSKDLADIQNAFSIGATSHMATSKGRSQASILCPGWELGFPRTFKCACSGKWETMRKLAAGSALRGHLFPGPGRVPAPGLRH